MKITSIVLSLAAGNFVLAAFTPVLAAGSCKNWLATCNSRTGGQDPSCSTKYSD
jgi:hypothetical protein